MRQIVFVVLAVLGITGCAARPAHVQTPIAPEAASSSAAAPENLRGTDWRFVEVEGTRVPDGVVATLHLRDGRASGKAGCNSYGASWDVSAEGGIRFGQTMSTKMACMTPAGAMQVERGVFDVLQRAVQVRREGETLMLLDASGQPLATLAPDSGA